jgi:beta propeller repeat protein
MRAGDKGMKSEEHVRLALIWLVLFSAAFIICPPSSASGTETLISTQGNGLNHQLPKIFNDQIVWQDSDTAITFGIIYLYNITSGIETQVTDNTSYTTNPTIYGKLITYTDCGGDSTCGSNSTIYLYNITAGTRIPLSSGSDWQDYSALYGNRIVWQDTPGGGNAQIYINGTSPALATPVPATGGIQLSPAIYRDLTVWQDINLVSGNPEIYLFNLTLQQKTQVTNNPSGSDQSSPAIYGNRIVWQDYRNGNYEIFMNGTVPGDEYSLTPNDGIDHQYPAISGNWVVWTQTNAFNNDIVVNDTITHQKLPIALDRQGVTVGPSISWSPVQSLYRIVWGEQDTGGNYNVFLYTNSSHGTCPVAGFTDNYVSGTAPVTVRFTDTSGRSPSNPITHWFWDFGDGSNSTLENPSHTYSANGAHDVSLTVSNAYCRNATTVTNSVVVGRPVAGFTASPTSGVVNTMIAFTDTSLGNPTQWNWSWGDGTWTNGTTKNPTHRYTNPGSYTVSLIASTVYGSDTKTKAGYITVLAGANELANTTINGITIQDYGGRQHLVFNYATLTDWTFNPNSSVLDFTPSPDRGYHNITIYTTDPGGFLLFPGNTTIAGTISSVQLQTTNITPTGFSVSTGGPFSSVNYTIDLPSYPENAVLNTQVWEGATASDATNFNYIATGSHFSGTNGTAYTMKIIKTNFPSGGTARLYVSLNASLVASKPLGRNEVFVERISDDRTFGEVLNTTFLYHNSTENLDYFEADSPRGLSTFGVSFLEGAGNPFQLITLTIASYVSPPAPEAPSSPASSSASGGPGSGGGKGATAPAAAVNPDLKAPPEAPDPGKTASLYTNANGVITQETNLKSNDNLASLTIGPGILAKDVTGNPVSSISIASIPQTNIPSLTEGQASSFAGRAYELGPNGATFSPAISLSFTVPQAQWGREYTIRTFDRTSSTWQDLPSSFDHKTGIVTATVNHFCCFALFSQAVAEPTAPAVITTPLPVITIQATAQPPSTAVSIFFGMIMWVADNAMKNSILIAGLIIVCVIVYAGMSVYRKRNGP